MAVGAAVLASAGSGCGAATLGGQAVSEPPVVVVTNAPPANAAAGNAHALPSPAPPPELPAPVEEIVHLAKSGVKTETILRYIESSPHSYNLTADQVIYLHDLGIAPEVITAMMRHGQQGAVPSPEGSGAAHTNNPASSAAPSNVLPKQPLASSSAGESMPAAKVQLGVGPSETKVSDQGAPSVAAPVPVAVPVAAAAYPYYYNVLSPYGSWVEVAPYGWCWQPSAVVCDPGWRPYGVGGRWLYTDDGWYWYSDYSWGWIPFHYGRWYLSSARGWVWVPGYTWGPAWVSWRYSDDYCGWAPLPPAAVYVPGDGFFYNGVAVGIGFGFGLSSACYTFVPFAHFCDWRPWRHHLPHRRVRGFFHDTRVINNYVTIHRRVINVGLNEREIRQRTHGGIRRVVLRQMRAVPGHPLRPELMNGATLAVYRPRIDASTTILPLNSYSADRGHREGIRSGGRRGHGMAMSRPVAPAQTRFPSRDEWSPLSQRGTSARSSSSFYSQRREIAQPDPPRTNQRSSGRRASPTPRFRPSYPAFSSAWYSHSSEPWRSRREVIGGGAQGPSSPTVILPGGRSLGERGNGVGNGFRPAAPAAPSPRFVGPGFQGGGRSSSSFRSIPSRPIAPSSRGSSGSFRSEPRMQAQPRWSGPSRSEVISPRSASPAPAPPPAPQSRGSDHGSARHER